MWGALLRVILKGARKVASNKLLNPFKPKNIIKKLNPFNKVKNALPNKIFKRQINKPFKVVKKLKTIGKLRKAFLVKNVLREEILEKATLIDQLANEEDLILQQKSAYNKQTSELVEKITGTRELIKLHNLKELKEMNKMLNKELEGYGVKSRRDMELVVENEEFRKNLVVRNAYEDFMENWKNGFFAYSPEELGMSEDERLIVWQEIMDKKDYAWYEEMKV